jgi:hypothetical protein
VPQIVGNHIADDDFAVGNYDACCFCGGLFHGPPIILAMDRSSMDAP